MAKLPPVKCKYCDEYFPRDGSVEFVAAGGRRYAHKTCATKEEQKNVIRNQIFLTTKKYLGNGYNHSKVDNQVKALLKEGKTEIGILRAIEYWYETKKGDPSKACGGIGIVKSIYGEAFDYYQKLEEIKKANEDIDFSQFLAPEVEEYKFKPKPIQRPKRVKLFDLK